MTKIKLLIYKLLNILYAYIGNLILKIDVNIVFNLKFVESKIGNYYRTKDYNRTKTKKRKYVIARHVLRVVLRNNTNMTLEEIANKTMCASHDNVINSLKQVDNLIQTDKVFRKGFYVLIKDLNLKYQKYKGKINSIEVL